MTVEGAADPSLGSRVCFEELVGRLEGTEAGSLADAELEGALVVRGRELLRRMHRASWG